MLAILTKMTLTQVSTWFANARRRLKKENKMTWSPRNRCGERKDSEGYSDDEDDDDDVESKADDVNSEEKSPFRMTTVIKSPEGRPRNKNTLISSSVPTTRSLQILHSDWLRYYRVIDTLIVLQKEMFLRSLSYSVSVPPGILLLIHSVKIHESASFFFKMETFLFNMTCV